MAKLTDFVTPTGARGNLLDPRSLLSLVIGTFVLLLTFSLGQNVARAVSKRAPMLDTSPDPIFRSAVPVENGPKKIIL